MDLSLSLLVHDMCNDHPWDSKIVAVVGRCSLFRGHESSKSSKWDLKLFQTRGRYSEMFDSSGINFIIILRAAFTCNDPKRAKNLTV